MRKPHTRANEAWADVHQALELLGVKRETLYAYVSRRHIRSKPMAGDHRASVYAIPDIQRMAAKRRRPRKRADVAKSTIKWGEPILETSISTVINGQLVFGSKDACELAETYSLEDVAHHHWKSKPPRTGSSLQAPYLSGSSPKARGFAFLARKAGVSPHIFGQKRDALTIEAASLLSAFADNVIGKSYNGPVHARLAQAWKLSKPDADLIRRALVLISDHELNASTFAVRVAASTGASLPASALAGLAALTGPLHGDATEKATDYLRAAIRAVKNGQLIERFLKENPKTPGMGHTLYPGGDIRAKALLAAINSPEPVTALLTAFEIFAGKPPDIDMAHAALAVKLDLPKGAGFMIFAIGRMSGWLAHAIEQNETGELIRPRAIYRTPGKS